MQIYVFDAESREFLRSEEAFPDPLESRAQGREVWLLPANAIFTAPPEAKPGHAVCWNGSTWEYREDHRQSRDKGGVIVKGSGTPFWMPGDTWQSPARYMAELGPLPEGALLEKPAKPAKVVAQEQLQAAKSARALLVEKSTVTIDGMVFDADEASQNRLVRGIVASLALGLSPDETTEWTLADNSSAMITAQQMARALLAAGQYQTSVWRMPYEQKQAETEQALQNS